ncbi:MAG: RNA-binding domain-containing protein [Rhodoferax sp.]
MPETHRVEYKRELTPELDLEKEVIAFLNTPEGGFIYIGIDKVGQRVGVADVDGDMLKVKDRIKNNITPSAMGLFDLVEEEGPPGVHCIKLIVASGSEKPYAKKKYGLSEKGCFLRIGTAAEPMPAAMIEKLFATRTRNSIGKIKAHRQALSFEQLRIYYDEKRKPLNKQFKTNLELTTEDGALNYAAYLLADENGTSIKVAKYRGKDRIHLIESNEYGYCSLIKATKSVLDKLDLENKTASTITAKERIDVRLWRPIALREAVINAIVHNDYTREVPPKFEIFADRIELTSACALPEGLTQAEFFEGYSLPRNTELMRVFRDLEMVEHLGSGLPRITEFYGPDCFRFTENFLRITFPASRPVYADEERAPVAGQATEQVESRPESQLESRLESRLAAKVILQLNATALGKLALAQGLGHQSVSGELNKQIRRLLDSGLIEYTLPDKPNSRLQQYRLTDKGRSLFK